MAEKLLLIANPAAGSGAGAAAAEAAAAALRARLGDGAVVVAPTAGPRHASALASNAEGCDTIVALGGDGLVHEVVNGLMKRPAAARPCLGVIPVGSGNDYARALGMPRKIEAACDAILSAGAARSVDLGLVNGEYFAETLSFGLDAAIALDTVQRRKRTGKTGVALYMASGFDQLLHHLDAHAYRLVADGGAPVRGQSITFAVQVGPYYGGGFKICPDAALGDGLLDVCISHAPVSAARAVAVFMLAKEGKHIKTKPIEIFRASRLRIDFDHEPPAQIDGERIEAASFDVSVVPGALRVFAPAL